MSKNALVSAASIIGISLFGLAVSALVDFRPAPTRADGLVATPTAEVIRLNLYASVSSDGSGEASAHAELVGGQARAEIRSSGAGRGDAQAQAPVCAECQRTEGSGPVVSKSEVSQSVGQPTATPIAQVIARLLPPVSTVEPVALVVTGDLVNVRNEPTTSGAIVSSAYKGQRMTGLERSGDGSWWRIGDGEWVYYALVERVTASHQLTSGPAGQLDSGAPTPIAAPNFRFSLELIERHQEVNNVTLYAFIHEDGRALDGHFLAVTVNGVAAPGVRERSAAVPLGETRPACKGVIFDATLCAGNRIYNLKQAWDTRLMYPGFSPWGEWRVQLVDGGGQALGPWAIFTVQPGQTDLELYVRYRRDS